MTLPSGTRFGPYELVALLGAGGMGEVYKARDTRLDRTVAIKVLPQRGEADPDRRARLEREARAISALNHPNICTLYDVGDLAGSTYLVMEHLEGESLAQRLERGPLPLDQLLRVGIEIAEALERAHRQGIVHRDLKPANVMLTKTGAKLLDFGIAKAAVAAHAVDLTTPAGQPTRTPLTAAGVIVGTLHYMAPEQLEAREIDARADIFALGALLYEMATGEHAFSGGSQASLIAAILEKQPPPLSTRLPMAPAELDRLVILCLAKDPDERWQSAHDVRLQLEAIASHTAPVIAAAGRAKRHRWERFLWAGATALLAAAVAWAWWSPRGAGPAPTLRLALLPPAGITSSGPLALSPDGRRVAFVGYGEDGVARLFVRALDEVEARPLVGTEDASLPFWAPDGRSLGFFAQRRLKRIELEGGPPRILAEVSDARGGTWGRDDTIVFSPNPGDGLYRIAADGGAPAVVTRLDSSHGESSHRWPAFLPDGRRVLYLALSPERERYGVQGVALADPRPQMLFPADSGALALGDRLLFVRAQTLLAQPFNEATMTLRGTPRPLVEGIWRDPDLDGLRAFAAAGAGTIAYRRGGSELTRLVWLDREGREQGMLGAPGAGGVIALSPDGRRVARSLTEEGAAAAGLWMLDAASGAASRLTFNRWNDIYPVWSPDGRRIAFSSDRTGGYNLYAKPADGAGEETLLLRSDLWNFAEDWSADGSLLAFTQRDPKTKGDVWVLELASGEPRPLLRGEADELQPRLAPNGRFFAYASDESGRSEVYVQTLPPSAAKWQVSIAGGFQPQWRRDGRELFFLGPDLKLMAAEVDTRTGAFSTRAPRALFPTRSRRSNLKGAASYLASPDGQRFLIDSQIGADQSSPVQLVLDWRPAEGDPP